MRKFAPVILLAGCSVLLTACGGGGGVFNRERPDEFAVQRQAPLVVPPDFTLTPPAPGELRTFVCYEGPNATTAYRAAAAQACPVSPLNANAKTWEHLDYDGMGRLTRERKTVPGTGVAKRFIALQEAYADSKDVTRRRLYLETMEQILPKANKIVLDEVAGKEVVPYLPLEQAIRPRRAEPEPPAGR